MSTTSPEVLIELDRSRPRGLRAQVEDELRRAIQSGRLAAGTRLPSTRALAADLGVTRGVVVAAYDQLLAEGYLTAAAGSGTVVNPNPSPGVIDVPQRNIGAGLEINFSPGLPDLDLFPRAAWASATRAALTRLPSDRLGYTDPRGLPELRSALVDYLGRVRGVAADPDRVFVCAGFAHGFSLVVSALRATGHERFALEDPGATLRRTQIEWAGARHHPVDVDDDGIVVDQLRRSPARVVVVTPAHQYPTGAVLAPTRRRQLVAWAREVDGYIVEDDYDAEYRYDRHPVGAIQGVAPERVIYGGTLSKSLAPGMRLGWMVVPAEVVDPLLERRALSDHSTSALTQATFAEFLLHGDLDRHLRRTRRIYRQRRDALVAALARELPEARPSGVAAGLHVLVTLPLGLDENTVAERAAAEGVGVTPLGQNVSNPTGDRPPGLVLGYGQLDIDRIERGVQGLARAVNSRSPAPPASDR